VHSNIQMGTVRLSFCQCGIIKVFILQSFNLHSENITLIKCHLQYVTEGLKVNVAIWVRIGEHSPHNNPSLHPQIIRKDIVGTDLSNEYYGKSR